MLCIHCTVMEYSQTHLSAWNWDLLMSIHISMFYTLHCLNGTRQIISSLAGYALSEVLHAVMRQFNSIL